MLLGARIRVELGSVLGLTHAEVQNALDDLQEFSMTARDTSLPGGAAFKVPVMMGLITPLVEKVVTDHASIKKKSNEFRTLRRTKTPFVGLAISRTMAFLNSATLGRLYKLRGQRWMICRTIQISFVW